MGNRLHTLKPFAGHIILSAAVQSESVATISRVDDYLLDPITFRSAHGTVRQADALEIYKTHNFLRRWCTYKKKGASRYALLSRTKYVHENGNWIARMHQNSANRTLDLKHPDYREA